MTKDEMTQDHLQDIIAKLPDPEPMDGVLRDRLLDIPRRHPRKAYGLDQFIHWLSAPKRLIPQAAGFATAAFLGIMAGLPGEADDDGDLSAYVLGADYSNPAEWDLEGEEE